jgi:hypothetical protein
MKTPQIVCVNIFVYSLISLYLAILVERLETGLANTPGRIGKVFDDRLPCDLLIFVLKN